MNVEHDPGRHRFLVRIDGHEAYLLYQPLGEKLLDYESTYVPDHLRGRGVATIIVRHALDYARAQGYRVRPTCWFVKEVIERFPEYRPLAA